MIASNRKVRFTSADGVSPVIVLASAVVAVARNSAWPMSGPEPIVGMHTGACIQIGSTQYFLEESVDEVLAKLAWNLDFSPVLEPVEFKDSPDVREIVVDESMFRRRP
jgi:hypothetical protein